MHLPTESVLYGGRLYRQYEERCGLKNKRKCIDGKLRRPANCVAYCEYEEHPGFLSDRLRQEHGCLEKKCRYYVGKSCGERVGRDFVNLAGLQDELLASARKRLGSMCGVKILSAEQAERGGWRLNYITITNDYSLLEAQKSLEAEWNCAIEFKRLNYDFDVCARLIMEGEEED